MDPIPNPDPNPASTLNLIPNPDPTSVPAPGPTVFGALFVPVKAGTFMMGSPVSEKGRNNNELRHQVTLTKDFEMGATEVTQFQYFDVMGSNISFPYFSNKEKYCPESYMERDGVQLCTLFPVTRVSYKDVKDFLIELNKRSEEEGEGYVYRLPTEAEWEYAVRGGSETTYFFGNDYLNLGDYAWYLKNSERRIKAVALKKPNPLGLYDVYGNAWEWIEDWLGDYPAYPVTDPKGPDSGLYRVLRGGNVVHRARVLRSALRSGFEQLDYGSAIGFRLVRTPKQD